MATNQRRKEVRDQTPAAWPKIRGLSRFTLTSVLAALTGACGLAIGRLDDTAPRFTIPISVNEEEVGVAIVDTGGGYDLMLADPLGLDIVDTVEILVFNGIITASVTEPFTYTAGGFSATAESALVGVDLCDCNGLGFFFLRRSGAVLGLNFDTGRATLASRPPRTGLYIPFAAPPPQMSDFDTAFLEVQLSSGNDETAAVIALLDTGSNVTLVRRGLVDESAMRHPDLADVLIARGELGTVSARVSLFDTPGLPDLLIGTDVLRAWSHRWHFVYRATGGLINAVPRAVPEVETDTETGTSSAAKRLSYRIAP